MGNRKLTVLAQHIPEPVLFHPLKHHLPYIRQFILNAELSKIADLKAALRTIGSSQLDLYTGELTPFQIAQEAKAFLDQQEIRTPEAYKVYLTNAGADFSVVRLSDKSEWVLRWGLVKDRYVHLHPARYSYNTMRVKATSLKTAITTLVVSNTSQAEINLGLINNTRKDWLDLPPVKVLSAGLIELISLINPCN